MLKFYSQLLIENKINETPRIGIDCLGFSYIIYKSLCYIGLIISSQKGKMPNKVVKKYSDNIFSDIYIKARIVDDYKIINFEEYIPISLVTGNIHELRGLNSKIVSSVDELIDFKSEKDWESSFDKADKNHKKIYVASRLTRFILDKLKLTRPDFFETARINTDKNFEIQRSVNKIVKIFRNDFKNKHLYSEGFTNQNMPGEKEYFEILLMILIENAIKYSIDLVRLYPRVRIQETMRRGQKVTITVSSYGQLIPKEDKERIFEPGFRSNINRSIASGTGMGLTNARKLAALFNCTLTYDCEYPVEQGINAGWNDFKITYMLNR
ncbi:hypothetical protein AM218_14905 [Hymenobacter sp. DG25A]|nr:hypothetical protein AM218_14905 [Hymenobacter sp. DG25A]